MQALKGQSRGKYVFDYIMKRIIYSQHPGEICNQCFHRLRDHLKSTCFLPHQ